MADRQITLPGGLVVTASDEYSDDDVYKFYGLEPPQRPRRAWSAGVEGLKSTTTQGAPLAWGKATGTLSPLDEARYMSGLQDSARRQDEMLPGGPASFADVRSGDAGVGDWLGENFAYSAPQMIPSVVGAIGGGIVGNVPGALAGGALGQSLVAPSYVGSNVDRATEGGQRPLSREYADRALVAGAGQAAIDVGAEALLGPVVGRAFPGGQIGGSLLRRAAVGAGKGFALEGASGIGQQALERWSVGEDVFGPGAGQEYTEAGLLGGVLGGALGAVGGTFNARPQAEEPFDIPAVEPIGERTGPVSLLALPGPDTISPRPSGPTLFADAEGVASENPASIQVSRAAEPGADLYRRMSALEAQPAGAQADWVDGDYRVPEDTEQFSAETQRLIDDAGDYRVPEDTEQFSAETQRLIDDAGDYRVPGQPELAFPASSTVANDFDTTRITRILRGPGKVDSFVAKTAPRLATAFKTNDVRAAQSILDDATETLQADAKLSPATVEARRAVLERAQLVVDTFKSRLSDAFNQEATTQREVAPTPATVAVDPAPVEPAVQGYAPADVTARNETMAATDVDRRAQLLQRAVNTPRVRNVEGLFQRMLAREKLDTTVSDEELGQLVDAMDQRQAMDAEAAARDEAAAQTSTADIEAQIPERQAPAAPMVPEAAEVAEPAAMAEATETTAQEVAQIAAPAVSARQQAMADMAAERAAPAVEPAVDTTATEKLIEAAFDRKEIVPTQFTQLKHMLEAKAPPATVEAALDAAKAQTAQTLARYSSKRWAPKPTDLIVEHNGKQLNMTAMDDLFQRLRAELTYKGFDDAALKLVLGDDVRAGKVPGLPAVPEGEALPYGNMTLAKGSPKNGFTEAGRRIIQVVADQSLAGGEMRTLNHEIIHLAKDMNVWTPAEWSTLETWAAKQTDRVNTVDKLYAADNLTDEQTMEEVIAEAYADWEHSRAPVPPQIRTLFQKLKDFLAAIGRTLKLLPPAQKAALRTYLSFGQDVDTIFGDLSSGAIGDRPRSRFNLSPLAARAVAAKESRQRLGDANPTRRDILAGAAVAGIATAADAATPKVSIVGRDVVMRAIDSGSLQKTVEAVRDTTKNEGYREVARILAVGGLGQSKIAKNIMTDPDRLFTRYGDTDSETGDVNLYQDTEISGLTEETILHEAIHSFLSQRVGDVGVHSVASNRVRFKSKPAAYDDFETAFAADWSALSNVLIDKFAKEVDDANPDYNVSVREAARSADELFVRIFTDPELKDFLQGIDKNGYKVRKGQPSWWSRLMDTLFGWLGGKTPASRNAFDHIMSTAQPMLKAAALKETNDPFVQNYKAMLRDVRSVAGERTQNQMAGPMRRAATDEVKQATKTIAGEMIGDKPARYASAMMLNHSLIDFARSKGLLSATAYDRLNRQAGRITGVINERVTEMAAAYAELPTKQLGTGEGTLNSIAEASTRSGKWAFEPDWLTDEDLKGRKVEVDPQLAAQLKALGPKAEASAREMFRLSYDNAKKKKALLLRTMRQLAAREIKEARATGNKSGVARIRSQLGKDIAHAEQLNDVDTSKPYASLQRQGDKVVVARSDAFIRTEEAARAGDRSAIERLAEMKGDAAHYFFDAFDGNAEQMRVKAQLEKRPEFAENVDVFTKSDDEYLRAGGMEMMSAFRRLSNMLEDQTVDDGTKANIRVMQRLLSDMELRTLSSSSSRKAELRRLGVDSMPLDIMQNVINQARSDAHFLGALSTVHEKMDVLARMKREARTKPKGETTADKMAAYTEIMKREAASMEPPKNNTLVDRLLAATSAYMLTASPAYFLQQLLQTPSMSLPQMAAEFGYGKSVTALLDAIGTVKKAWGKTPLAKPLDFDALDPRMAELGRYLQDEGQLDVGLNQDLGNIEALSANPLSKGATTVFSKLRSMVRLIEAVNRFGTGAATFNLALRAGSTAETLTDTGAYAAYKANRKDLRDGGHVLTPEEFAAAQHARKIISLTHGIYSPHAKPRFMNTPVGRVATQFRVFQILQLTLWADAIKKTFGKTTDPTERLVAKRALGFMLAHTTVLAGGLGLPGMGLLKSLVEMVWDMFGGDDDEPADLERVLREAVPDHGVANLLLYGAPSLAGLDLSGSLGSGNVLSVAPYADPITDKRSLESYFTAVFGGPSVAGMGGNIADGIALMGRGSYHKGLERMVPKGVANVMKASREATEGRTNRSGDVTRAPEDVDAVQTIYTALGLRTAERANEQWALNTELDRKQFQKDKAGRLKRDYAKAAKDRDTAEMARLRKAWVDLQANKPAGERQPLSELLKAPTAQRKREQQTAGGVQYSARTRQRAEELADLTGLAEEEPE